MYLRSLMSNGSSTPRQDRMTITLAMMTDTTKLQLSHIITSLSHITKVSQLSNTMSRLMIIMNMSLSKLHSQPTMTTISLNCTHKPMKRKYMRRLDLARLTMTSLLSNVISSTLDTCPLPIWTSTRSLTQKASFSEINSKQFNNQLLTNYI